MILFLVAMMAPSLAKADDTAAQADDSGSWWEAVKNEIGKIWNSDQHKLIIPVNIYHVRASYDKENIKKYNEMPWGLGIERYYKGEDRTTHSLYAVTFADSFNNQQPTFGYNWQKNWYFGGDDAASAGVGYAALLTFRKNRSSGNYTPIPGITPTASIGYMALELQTAWVPYMGRNNGNVFLTMLTWKF